MGRGGDKKQQLGTLTNYSSTLCFLVEGFEKRIQLMCAAVAQADEEAAFDRRCFFFVFVLSPDFLTCFGLYLLSRLFISWFDNALFFCFCF